MAEFTIKRVDAHNADPIKDKRGCYKRGDIINVQSDGEYANSPHLTVLKVPGLSAKETQKYIEYVFEEAQVAEVMKPGEYDTHMASNSLLPTDLKVNNKDYTRSFHDFVSPVTVRDADGKNDRHQGKVISKGFKIIEGARLEEVQRRRFSISEDLMQSWFPDGVNIKVIDKADFERLVVDELIDKAHNRKKVKDANWRKAELRNGD